MVQVQREGERSFVPRLALSIISSGLGASKVKEELDVCNVNVIGPSDWSIALLDMSRRGSKRRANGEGAACIRVENE